MLQRFVYASLIAFAMLTGFFAYNTYSLNQIVQEKDQELFHLTREKDEMELQTNTKLSGSTEPSYTNWIQSSELADQLYKESEGRFEKEWGLFLGELTQEKGMDPYIVYELLKVETGGSFDPNVEGPKTRFGVAYGMAQFMTNTAPWIADRANLEYKKELLFEPLYSIQLSVEYLDYLYEEYEDWDYALTAYNRGMTGLKNYVEKNGHARSDYAVTIQQGVMHHESIAFNN
ncbi:lytic transglycosylase domain-containing protein [Alkalicoccobacillus murimartini]|uniref:Soluble lytic murein transglycosylase-like protein n=1 Tax=Alkalicoccobacillus murimartini TaxID=171685 RepID=A0ABT9YCI9_9BACI|nr:transglycosylase SLT domain-containing protein [Alkalicoccobacillus murimartini]MDQ0205567.1 soluble lytic murein transglycosylase-like protein [Alkalicoccobacillus murimartini]